MKKTAAAAVLAAVLVAFTGCGEKKQTGSAPESDNIPVTENVQDNVENPTEETTSAVEEVTETTTDAKEPATEKTTEKSGVQEDPTAAEELSDQEILEIAEGLYQTACETEWSFTVGSPFALDTSSFVENDINWQFFLVTEEGVSSMEDVYREYHKVFAEEYDDHLDELFIEKNGRVYCLNGTRGSDIFYSRSEITEIREKTDDRVVMTVTDHYDGTDLGEEPYSADRDFAMVNTGDGWRVSEFTLPY